MAIVKEIYDLTSHLPNSERYGLTDQIRRAAVSVPSNIAEGQARASDREFIRFLHIANGSAAEVITQLYICGSLGYVEMDVVEDFENKIVIIQKMISKLIISKEHS